MILDKQNLFSDKQDLVGVAGNKLSTNTIDIGATGKSVILGQLPNADVGAGEHVDILVQCVSTFAGGTSVQAQLVQATDAALTAGLDVLTESAAIPLASLVPGYQFSVRCLVGDVTKRYLGIRYVTVGTFTGANLVTAGIVCDRQSR